MTSAVVEHPAVQDVVASARRLAPQIVAAREEAERMQRTPPALAQAIGDAGLYQMFYTRNPLERHFRDIHVALQHNSAFRDHYESAGKVLMRLKPSAPGW